MVTLTAVAALMAVAAPASAAPGESQVPIPNPDLDAACGIDILVILDESGSIANAGATEDVKTAFRAFTAALNNTGSRMAVAEFSSVARLPLPGGAQRA
jgi:large repetitive protein